MSQPRKIILVTALLVISLVAYSLVFSAPDALPNICNAGEFWEGLCLSTEDWEAGWYLHPENDPGGGLAVTVAYSNYEAVISHMPHQMCIDWRTANCDGTTPPEPPVRKSTKDKGANGKSANSASACIRQANSQSSIGSYCRALHTYDSSLSAGDAGFDAKKKADKATFVAGLTTSNDCAVAAAYIAANGSNYSAGNLNNAGVMQMEAAIETVQSWACETFHNRTPPSIPDPPS